MTVLFPYFLILGMYCELNVWADRKVIYYQLKSRQATLQHYHIVGFGYQTLHNSDTTKYWSSLLL